MTWFQPKGYERAIQGPIHKIYVYIDEDKKYAYVGATNNIDRRDYEHRTNSNDSVFKYFANEGKDVPKYKILRECLIREKVVTFRMVKLNMLLSIFLITK